VQAVRPRMANGGHDDEAAGSMWTLVEASSASVAVHAAAVDYFWLHTWPLWRARHREELRDLLQECALFAKQPWLLRKLRTNGLYDARRNKPDMLHDVGSVEACCLLLSEGFHVDNICGQGIPPLFDVRTRAVASCLLDAGASLSLVLLNATSLPPVRVLDWLLELRPRNDVWPAAWPNLFAPGRLRQDSMLDIVGVLAKWHCELPRDVVAAMTDAETLAALFTYGYITALPARVMGQHHKGDVALATIRTATLVG
jgi:hypothetical protein